MAIVTVVLDSREQDYRTPPELSEPIDDNEGEWDCQFVRSA